MKIQCDFCNKEGASVFCTADEAALCDGCDHRVHHANKLAGKHLRFSLLQPSLKEFPRCDICQEKRAFLFCKQDRAILCRECDFAIHKANEHTQKHNRFLLTGVKLSASSSLYPNSSSSNRCNAATDQSSEANSIKKPNSISSEMLSVPSAQKTSPSTNYKVPEDQICEAGSVSTSSIAEYLMETLPGWRVDDFLDPSPAPQGFSKTHDNLQPFTDQDFEKGLSSFPSPPEDLAIWVPQLPPASSHLPSCLPHASLLSGFNELEEAITKKASRKLSVDCFTVPQMSKKSRQFW